MTRATRGLKSGRKVAVKLMVAGLCLAPLPALAQTRPATKPSSIPPEFVGRTVDEVRIVGKTRALGAAIDSQIRHTVRTREGDKFDPETVREDYQRIYELKKFGNVEARFEPTANGVIVVFEVAEQNLIRSVGFKGNANIDTSTIQDVVDLRTGEAIDQFRLSTAKDAIERLYKSKNYSFATAKWSEEDLTKNGDVVFNIVEGPRVVIRKVQILGNTSFTDGKVKDNVKTESWFPIFQSGTFDRDQVEQDVGSIRQFYVDHGFFDARVGYKLVFNADQTELMVTFEIDEGPRYKVTRITFHGNTGLTEAQLRPVLKMTEGRFYDKELTQRDVKEIVRAYSPLGYIFYQPPGQPANPDYLQVSPRPVFQQDQPGSVQLVYEISEGKPFRVGRIEVKGNYQTQQKVIIREMRVAPGDKYNAGELSDAMERVRGLNFFTDVKMTPVGNDPDSRDVLIELTEQKTARFMIGAGISTVNGLIGNISFEQRNFDISALPTRLSDFTNGRAFVGAGQYFRINLEPGTQTSRANIDFVEPWVFDQPYSFGSNIFYSTRTRDNYDETRAGAKFFIGKRFLPYWSARASFRAENIRINHIENEAVRAPEILEAQGNHTLTSFGLDAKRDSTDSVILPTHGSILSGAWEWAGAFGGEYDYHKFIASWDYFQSVHEDLLDRRTVLRYHLDGGYITGDSPFFEKFYAGDRGSVRGFRYRGISPRSGPRRDAVGGDFLATGSLELNFPIYSDVFRGVVFTDAGTVERDLSFGTIRTSAGIGIRWTLPFFGQVPLAFDFAVPITKNKEDQTRFFSFSLGLIQ